MSEITISFEGDAIRAQLMFAWLLERGIEQKILELGQGSLRLSCEQKFGPFMHSLTDSRTEQLSKKLKVTKDRLAAARRTAARRMTGKLVAALGEPLRRGNDPSAPRKKRRKDRGATKKEAARVSRKKR